MKRNTDIARCYSFSFNLETMTFYFTMPKWILGPMKKRLLSDNLVMKYLFWHRGETNQIFNNFGECEKPFGYNEVVQWHSQTADEVVFTHSFSPCIRPTKEVCERCKGKKVDTITERPCYSCRGTGREHVSNEKQFSDFLVSLYPIIRFGNMAIAEQCIEKSDKLWHPQAGDKKQRVAIEYSCTSGRGNCNISGWVDDEVLKFVQTLPDEEMKSVAVAMRKIDAYLLLDKENMYGFRFSRWSDKGFGFEVPGSACTLSASEHGGLGMFAVGTTLYEHNVDHRFAQVCFFVGLATLSDLFEKSQVQEVS